MVESIVCAVSAEDASATAPMALRSLVFII